MSADADPAPEPSEDRKLPFIEHLRELRSCLRNAVIALLVSTTITFFFAKELYVLLARPLAIAWDEAKLGTASFSYGSLTEPFWTYFDLALWSGVFLASPVIFHQLWRFVAPGLYAKEKRIALPFAITSAVCFVGGAVFCYLLVFPAAFRFFLSYSAENAAHMSSAFGFLDVNLGEPLAIKPTLFMKQYLDLVTKMLLAFGLVFEMPLLIFFLSYAGIVTHRSLWRFNKYAVVLSFIVGGILTPGPDIVSQLMMAGPLIVLYNISIVVAMVVTRKREKAAETEASG